jgi:hypothetical protein
MTGLSLNRMGSFLLLGLFLAGAESLLALTIQPQVSVDITGLLPEKRDALFNIKDKLTSYIRDYDWDEEEPGLTLNFPYVIQFKSAVDYGTSIRYTAHFAGGNGSDIKFDEKTWYFTLDQFSSFNHSDIDFDSFTAMIDYHTRLAIAYEYDKLEEFGGDDQFQKAIRISDKALFDDMKEGWSRRREKLDDILDDNMRKYRTLRWVTHTAFWFRSVMHSDYDAWTTAKTALIMIEEINNPGALDGYWNANHRTMIDIIIQARDVDSIFKIMSLDSVNPQRQTYYQDKLGDASKK